MQATMPNEAGDSDLVDDNDSGDLASGLDGDDDGLNVTSNLSDEDDVETHEDEDAEHSDILALAEGSDNDDLIDLDEDLPEGLIDYDGSGAEGAPEEEEWAGFGGGQKRKREDENRYHGRRKKLRSLPTFASYEDYAKMIEDGPEDDV
jgi:ribosome biogenesis protein MAK21